jgi:hypothetical protein
MFSQFSYFGGVCVISAEVTSHAHDWLFISRRFVLQARSILQILAEDVPTSELPSRLYSDMDSSFIKVVDEKALSSSEIKTSAQ